MLLRKLLLAPLAVGLLLGLAVMPVSAATMTYTTLSDWTADLTGTPIIIDFSNFGGDDSWGAASGLTYSGVQFVGNSPGGHYTSVHIPDGQYNWGTGAYLQGPGYNSSPLSMHVVLPAGTSAAAATLMMDDRSDGLAAVTGTITVDISLDGTTFYETTVTTTGPPAAGNEVFFGVTAPSAIRWIDFIAPGANDQILMANFKFGDAADDPPSDTPEPLTALLMGSGLLLIAGRRCAWKSAG